MRDLRMCGSRRHWLRAAILLPALALLAAVALRTPAAPPARIPVTLVSITDGDTVRLVVQGREERCRLIGIDAPELSQLPWGLRAREALARLLRDRPLAIELDAQQRDRYGRLLIYLFAGETFVNERMVLDGHAVLLTIPPNVRYVELFTRAQQQARGALRGVWAPGAGGLQESPSEYRRRTQ